MNDLKSNEDGSKIYVAWLGEDRWHGDGTVLYGLRSYDQCEMNVLKYHKVYKGVGVFVQADQGAVIHGFDGKWDLLSTIEVPKNTLKSPHIPQGPGIIVRGPRYWRKGNKFYWEDGSVTEVPHVAERKIMFINPYCSHKFDYSKWTKKERAAVKAKHKAEIKAADDARKKETSARLALVKSAGKKLSELEFDAVWEMGFQEGRGF